MTPADRQSEEVYVSLIAEGVDLFGQGHYTEAQKVFWQAFHLRPYAPIVLFNLGRTMEELKNEATAIHFYEAAASQGNVDSSYQLATLYARESNKSGAVRHLKLYLKSTADSVDDECTRWARQTLNQLEPPKPVLRLVWNKGKRVA
jgi:tetratricopeptide (TPR) repeat protein